MLSDHQLHEAALSGLVQPYKKASLQPCSIDLTLGSGLLIEDCRVTQNNPRSGAIWNEHDLDFVFYDLAPGEFVLAHTEEIIQMPPNMVGDLVLRSSAARMGFDHCLSGLIDPGFEGQLTLELRNNLRCGTLRLEAGMRIAQLTVDLLDTAPEATYEQTGWYQGQMGATKSNGRVLSKHCVARHQIPTCS